METSGTAAAPIVYSGNAWGTGRCRWDGADFVTTRVPTSQADAGGWSLWANADARIAEWDPSLVATTWLFDGQGYMPRAQYPRPTDYVLFDDVDSAPGKYFTVSGTRLNSVMEIEDSAIATLLSNEIGRAIVWVWVSGSQFSQHVVQSVTGNVIKLDGVLSSTAYTPTTRIFIQNRVADVTQAGDWCQLAPGKAIYLRRDSSPVRRCIYENAEAQRGAIRNKSASGYNVFRGFDFSGFGEGGVISTSSLVTGWQIYDNVFSDVCHGSAISLAFATGTFVTQNRITRLPLSSGIEDGAANSETSWNILNRCGETAFKSFSDRANAEIHHNIISFCNGVHANGLSIYDDQTNVNVHHNAIYGSTRPATTQTYTDDIESNRTFANNLFVARSDGSFGFRDNDPDSWNGLSLLHNLSIGPAAGMSVNRSKHNAVLENNYGNNGTTGGGAGEPPGIDVNPSPINNQSTWMVDGNVAISDSYLTDSGAILEPDRVDVLYPDGSRLLIDTRLVGL